MRVAVIILLLSGCSTIQVGLTYQASVDEEIMENPLAVIRGEQQFSEHFSGACEHISSVPMVDDLITFNHCGFFYSF